MSKPFPSEKTKQSIGSQIDMFGETIEDMRAAASRYLNSAPNLQMYAMGILSDAQELIDAGYRKQARQWVNKAKYFMSEVNEKLRAETKE